MREILFKAKHVHVINGNEHLDGTWVEGFLSDENYINSPELGGELLIDPKTICQYIGLTGKNGNKIWENDIVKVNGKLYIVHYYEPFAMYMLKAIKNGGGLNGMTARLFESEVIGNIFDNPELIGE